MHVGGNIAGILTPCDNAGRRLSWREIENGPSYIGTLQSYRIKHGDQDYDALTLSASAPAEDKPLPDLYEPALVLTLLKGRGYQSVNLSAPHMVQRAMLTALVQRIRPSVARS